MKSETLNLRVSVEFKLRLVEEARKEKRSVTNYIEAAMYELWSQKGSSTNRAKQKKERDKQILR